MPKSGSKIIDPDSGWSSISRNPDTEAHESSHDAGFFPAAGKRRIGLRSSNGDRPARRDPHFIRIKILAISLPLTLRFQYRMTIKMNEKIWLKSYEADVPDSIGEVQYDSVAAYIEDCCDRFSDLPAISNFGVSLTYAEFKTKSAALAGFFQSTLGLAKGDRLAIMLPNLLQYPITLLAALNAGLIVVNINPSYTRRELLLQLNDCGAKAIVIFSGCAHLLQNVMDQTPLKHVIVTEVGDLFPRAKAVLINFIVKYFGKKSPAWKLPNAILFSKAIKRDGLFTPVKLTHEDPAFLQYTGGTTGLAKGAILSHGNILANIVQTGCWVQGHLHERKETVIVALPLYHIFGLTINFLSHLQLGGLHILITDPRNTKMLVRTIKKSGFSVFHGVNALFAKLLSTPGFAELDFRDLRLVTGGGAAVQSSVAEKWQTITGVPICQAYGLTEASPGVCCNPLSLSRFSGSVGLPVPSTLVRICDESGQPSTTGEPGELCVKGPQVMQGYWQKPEETRSVLTSDGWLKTGDIAKMDEDGYVWIVDRKKDLIIVSGFNVYPNEVEDVLNAHPGIADAGVIGKAGECGGEIVVAYVVKAMDSLSKSDIEFHCRQNLVSYKVPREIKFVQEIPKSNIGKVLRRKLRESSN
jgi:long-chain acyl-CoA synthetase